MEQKMSNKELTDTYQKLQLEYYELKSALQQAARTSGDAEYIETLRTAEKAMKEKLESINQELIQNTISAHGGLSQ